ncbi:MAG: hypothetical protein NZM18_05055 [Thermoflexales bacterium]|nr:hypothetical protein [Thermoflexales bacterium]MDW8351494.1 hypothetical protein [Anaerolineae bacterium]
MTTSFRAILGDHIQRYPLMQAEDIYKLLHQACLGSEHAVQDLDGVRRWLTRELAEMDTGPDDPLIDPISPDGRIVRIHLRPYVAAGLDPAHLLEAFVRTANHYRGPRDELERALEEAIALAEARVLPCDARHLRELSRGLAAQGFPAIHHSDVYVHAYRPAYRVVARAYLRALG